MRTTTGLNFHMAVPSSLQKTLKMDFIFYRLN